jgi:hypothetical protein
MLKNVTIWQYVQVCSNNTWAIRIMNLKIPTIFFQRKTIVIYDASQICMHVILLMILGSSSM